jgi:solute carrier family 8 (sodium/calcium exchanger)
LLPSGLLGVAYLVGLIYIFVGISIISDIFMEAIEVITSQTKQYEIWEKDGSKKYYIEVPVWNATVANLTLMALGSSAPEILLSVIETTKDIKQVPGELGPSTIVGSAAFNLLMISALSILAVDDTPKKIADTGTFTVTSISSLFAYIWLYICLEGTSSPGIVTKLEGWLTLVFFFILIITAFITDKFNQYIQESRKSKEEIEEEEKREEMKIKKNQLRQLAKTYGESCIIEVAQGISTKETAKVSEAE